MGQGLPFTTVVGIVILSDAGRPSNSCSVLPVTDMEACWRYASDMFPDQGPVLAVGTYVGNASPRRVRQSLYQKPTRLEARHARDAAEFRGAKAWGRSVATRARVGAALGLPVLGATVKMDRTLGAQPQNPELEFASIVLCWGI